MLAKISANSLSFGVLLGVSTLFGCFGRTTEMGITVIAGGLGFAFANIDKFASIKGGGFEAVLKDQVKAIVEKETEQEPSEAENETTSMFSVEAYGNIDEDYNKVIVALKNPKYTWRYVSGVTKETGIARDKVINSLTWLESNALAKKSKGTTGEIWAMTLKGRRAFPN